MSESASRAIIVTGCSSGIGRAIAFALRRRSYRVFATVRDKHSGAGLAAKGIDILHLDLASSESVATAVAEIGEKTNGRIFGLVNNAAYGQPGAVEDLTRQTLRRQFETNLFGTHELTVSVLPMLRANGHGRIVQISSILGQIALPFRGAYNASKFALEGLTDTLRLELKDTPIRVSLVEPGPIATRFRETAAKALVENVNVESSRYATAYEKVLARLYSETPVRFTLPAESVVKPVVHALESRSPRIRYAVTVPSIVLSRLKRFLPDALFDAMVDRHR
jgi:NAD(P)-dependent dehydrogenase (short-subunit alcohol dehydrogenase family)